MWYNELALRELNVIIIIKDKMCNEVVPLELLCRLKDKISSLQIISLEIKHQIDLVNG